MREKRAGKSLVNTARTTVPLWIGDVRVEPIRDPAEGRWLEGLYMDTPEDWDYPYRFFRW